ncbi:MAG: hypothetical protein J6A47_09610 [Bacilli bacterium]|nr:hypothetical protein [Bacilli bacterium]MBO6285649.1 hypothetical protein [Bacilli bacterium]
MNFVKSRFRLKDVSLYFACATILLFIAAAIIYPLTGANEFNPVISSQLVAMLYVGAGVEVVSLFASYKEVRAIGFFLALYDLIIYAGTQGNYIANLLRAIDNHAPSASLISMIIVLVAALLCSLVSVITLSEKKAGNVNPAPKGE